MNPFHDEISLRAKGRCEYCRAPEEAFNTVFEVEHILPKARGGLNVMENFALSCPACNSYKYIFVTGYDDATETEVPLFHPRHNV